MLRKLRCKLENYGINVALCMYKNRSRKENTSSSHSLQAEVKVASIFIAARCTIVMSYRMSSVRPSVCLSVTLVDHDHIGWKSLKLIAQTISPNAIHLLPWEHGKILGRL